MLRQRGAGLGERTLPSMNNISADNRLKGDLMFEDRRGVALAIKSCLDSLKDDAERSDLDDLARFIGLAAMAAEEAAMAADPKAMQLKALMAGGVGHC
jgi:hypothetical protein